MGAAPPPGGHQIVPGPYEGPMSVRAAASFAQGGTTNAALSTTGRQGGGSKAGVFVLAVVGLLAVGGIGAVLALRYAVPKVQPAAAPSGAPADSAPAMSASAATGPSAAPSSAVASAAAPPPAPPAASAATDAPAPAGVAHGKNGKPLPTHATTATVAAPPPVQSRPVSLGELPDSVYEKPKK